MKATSEAPPESPTTARPLDFDEDAHETSSPTAANMDSSKSDAKITSTEEAPPTKPPRPQSPREQAEQTLKEAFPSIDAGVVRAVLTASGGQVEPAFNALLGMSDPDSQQREPDPPARPPRPAQGPPTTTAQSQLEADEMYARQLAEHYSAGAGAGRERQRQAPQVQGQQSQMLGQGGQMPSQNQASPERSFLDGWSDNQVNRAIKDNLPLDDLPVIRENIRKGFLETQSTVNKWIGSIRKKIDGDEEADDFSSQPARPAQGYQARNQSYGRRSGDMIRRSGDMDRYDADPELIDDDFSRLELRDTENAAPPKPARPGRPLANPDLFKPTPAPPMAGRKVSFQEGPPEEIRDMYSSSPKPTQQKQQQQQGSANKSSKWQPLASVDPAPVSPLGERENDPFSLGDSDDDKEGKAEDGKSDEAERLQNSISEAIAEDGTNKGTSEKGGTKA